MLHFLRNLEMNPINISTIREGVLSQYILLQWRPSIVNFSRTLILPFNNDFIKEDEKSVADMIFQPDRIEQAEEILSLLLHHRQFMADVFYFISIRVIYHSINHSLSDNFPSEFIKIMVCDETYSRYLDEIQSNPGFIDQTSMYVLRFLESPHVRLRKLIELMTLNKN